MNAPSNMVIPHVKEACAHSWTRTETLPQTAMSIELEREDIKDPIKLYTCVLLPVLGFKMAYNRS